MCKRQVSVRSRRQDALNEYGEDILDIERIEIHRLKKELREIEARLPVPSPVPKVDDTGKQLVAVWDDDQEGWFFIVKVGKRRTVQSDPPERIELEGKATTDEELRTEAIRWAHVEGVDARLYAFFVVR